MTAYPIGRPDDDHRFTFGFAVDVARIIEEHGYPHLSGLDLVRLQQALFGFIYGESP